MPVLPASRISTHVGVDIPVEADIYNQTAATVFASVSAYFDGCKEHPAVLHKV